MEYRELLYRILAQAFSKLQKYDGVERIATVYYAAELLQTIPLELESVCKGQGSYAEIINQLRTRAIEKGCEVWLAKIFQNLEQDKNRSAEEENIVTGEAQQQFNQAYFLHDLLYRAFINIRMEAHDEQNEAIFKLADLLHNLPLQLVKALQQNQDYEIVFTVLKARVAQKQQEPWLEQVIKTD